MGLQVCEESRLILCSEGKMLKPQRIPRHRGDIHTDQMNHWLFCHIHPSPAKGEPWAGALAHAQNIAVKRYHLGKPVGTNVDVVKSGEKHGPILPKKNATSEDVADRVFLVRRGENPAQGNYFMQPENTCEPSAPWVWVWPPAFATIQYLAVIVPPVTQPAESTTASNFMRLP